MSDQDRREFLKRLGLTAGAGAVAAGSGFVRPAWADDPATDAGSGPSGPLIRDGSAAGPAVVSSGNGLRATERAMEVIRGGGGTLEAVVSGVNIVESDPEDRTVGYGGLPNARGVVQLDSQVWHGPTRGAGAVGALEGFRNPSRVAMAVMRYTDHVMLVGEGAAEFARQFGFEEEELLTESSRQAFLRWRAELSDRDDYLTPEESGEPIVDFDDPGGVGATVDEDAEGEAAMRESLDGARPWGTIHCSAVDGQGDLSSVTTTSGLFFKVPGRVGDSPLPGCGCYCDNDVGGAGGTGRGEAVIKTIGAHTIVEEMRRGAHPQDACLEAERRIVDWTVEDRLLREDGRPNFDCHYYAIDKQGRTGAATIYAGGRHAVHDGTENRRADSAYLFEE